MDGTGLLRAYVEGRVSRRLFLRHLVRSGVGLAAAVAYADILASVPAEAATTEFYIRVADYLFSPTPAALGLGRTVQFGVTGVGEPEVGGHRIQSPPDLGWWFDSGWVTDGNYTPGVAAGFGLPGAGAYPYGCTDPNHPDGPIAGVVRVRPRLSASSVSLGGSVVVRWAEGTNVDQTFEWDVQRKDPGSSSWTSWRTATLATKRTFTPSKVGTYRFRARTRFRAGTAAGVQTGWSPGVSLTVI